MLRRCGPAHRGVDRHQQPPEDRLAFAESRRAAPFVGPTGDLIGEPEGEKIERQLVGREVDERAELHERVEIVGDVDGLPIHPRTGQWVEGEITLRREVMEQARRRQAARVGQGLDGGAAIAVAVEDRRREHEQSRAGGCRSGA